MLCIVCLLCIYPPPDVGDMVVVLHHLRPRAVVTVGRHPCNTDRDILVTVFICAHSHGTVCTVKIYHTVNRQVSRHHFIMSSFLIIIIFNYVTNRLTNKQTTSGCTGLLRRDIFTLNGNSIERTQCRDSLSV